MIEDSLIDRCRSRFMLIPGTSAERLQLMCSLPIKCVLQTYQDYLTNHDKDYRLAQQLLTDYSMEATNRYMCRMCSLTIECVLFL